MTTVPALTDKHSVVEICAGAGGQALGLEKAGFAHELAVEVDSFAVQTLRSNRDWHVVEGDVASPVVWDPSQYEGIDLLAGGVPCPPFSIAGKQLGASDERDLFAWAVELAARVKPRALMLENVRGLSGPRFAAYRQRVLDRLAELGYVADWRLLQSADFGVPQLRPRFVLVAMRAEDAAFFHWPTPQLSAPTVGEALAHLMAENDWEHVGAWVEMANDIGPTLVGGSKKRGGADLGPTRAKTAWLALGVDSRGIANEAPARGAAHPRSAPPKLTLDMVARLQGWSTDKWAFMGGKTAKYRQIGNAFPPPVASALGQCIIAAFNRTAPQRDLPELAAPTGHDEVYKILISASSYLSTRRILAMLDHAIGESDLERRIAHLSRDFVVDIQAGANGGAMYKLGGFKGFIGQADHLRNGHDEAPLSCFG